MYAVAAIPEPYRILGLRLRPLSLGHYLLLQRFGCKFIEGDGSHAGREDLLLGVLVCSMTYADFLEFIEQKNFGREIMRWGKKVGVFDLAEKSRMFQQYLRASLTEPDYIPISGADESGDWTQNLKITLTTRLEYDEATVMDTPIAKALADYYKLAENEGALRLISKEDSAAAVANAEALEKFAAIAAEAATKKEGTCQA